MKKHFFSLVVFTLWSQPFIQAHAQHRADASLKAMQQDPVMLEKRLKSVGTLIEGGSAARHLQENGAAALRKQAQDLHKQAQDAFQAGDYGQASELLGQAYRSLMEATRHTNPEEVAKKKKQKDFDARLASTKAMLEAQQRVSAEKSPKGEQSHITQVQKMLEQAQQLAASDLGKAKVLLDQAYLITKSAVGTMRQGDTLVRTLSFASKEEEYHYELDRYDTHQMLVKMLLQDKMDTPGVATLAQGFMDKAAKLREEAMAKAGASDFEAAVQSMEAATRELVRAIRSAGIFIPG